VVLRANINYRPRFVAQAYPATGSNLRTETIYPAEWTTGYVTTGFGALTEGGTVLGGYFDQAGLVNTLQADAFCRFESDARAMGAMTYGFFDVATGGVIVPVVLNPAARPYDAAALARGIVFYAQDGAFNTSANVTVGAGQVLNGAATVALPLGVGSMNLNVLPVRVFDNPALSDPDANVSSVAGGWNVICNFLIQYGTANYTVQLDGDWGGAWNDGVAGRIYAVPGSPYAAPGVQSRTVNILSASQPSGSYTFAIRVTDGLGAVYTYVWPTPVVLPGLGWTAAAPNPDSTGNVGQFSSMALVGGNPAIAYYDVTGTDLQYIRATDALGTAWSAPVVVDANGGQWISLKMVNGRPAIAYWRITSNTIRYVWASDATGTAWGASVSLANVGLNGGYTSLAVVNGNPAVSFLQGITNDLNYIRATDASGAAWPGVATTLDAAGTTGLYTSLAVVNSFPAISYYDQSNTALQYIRATDANGAGAWSVPAVIDSGLALRGTWTSMLVVNGNPAISYRSPSEIRYLRANDINGAAWNPPLAIDTVSDPGNFGTSLAIIQGNPAVAYYRTTGGDLYYRRATDLSGTAWAAAQAVDTPGDAGRYPSLLEIVGQPALSYYDVTNGDLKYTRYYP
jgi:hypothetical protein